MKVLHGSCFLEYDYGGAEPVTRALLELLPAEDVASAVVCLAGGPSPCRLEGIHRLPTPVGADSRYAQYYKRYVLFLQNRFQNRYWQRQIEKWFRINDFQLIHCHDLFWLGVLAPLARRYRKPLLFTCHLNLPFRLVREGSSSLVGALIDLNLRWQDRVTRKLARQAAAIVTPSQFCARAMASFLGGGAPPITAIPNWVDDYLLAESAHSPSAKAGTVVYVGRLSEEKGVGLLLKAAKQMPEVSFTLVGSNGRLEDQVRRERLIHWVPSVPHREIVRFLKQFEVAVCPSLINESFGRTALEYRLAGAKIVATRSGAIPEILDGYANVFWSEPKVASIEGAVRRALHHQKAAEDDRTRQDFLRKFSPVSGVNEYVRLYSSLCHERG